MMKSSSNQGAPNNRKANSNSGNGSSSSLLAMFRNTFNFRRGSNGSQSTASSHSASSQARAPATRSPTVMMHKKLPTSSTCSSQQSHSSGMKSLPPPSPSTSPTTTAIGANNTPRTKTRNEPVSRSSADDGDKKKIIIPLDCSKEVHAHEIKFDVVDMVMKSWEHQVKGNNPNWLNVGGELFLRRLFFRCPETIDMFGFPPNTQHDDPDLKNNPKFVTKSQRLIKAIDIAIGFLGPDLSSLESTLFDLGKRHVARQCRPYHWPIVGEALFDVFEAILGDDGWTPELREAWTTLYNFMGFHMIQGLIYECPVLASET
eukprot:CAMPEP_0119564262 /NCGR_PEP_ID=MMETSP1352-20130426/26444_1 /TAXON_ID=265584 /ORGANISM="Stauroneis constricta, Strain CCMP1120" /LENGTH=315 /DNA_ID=CAMNT_0007613005 /DNA_START=59 /DNA_END=1006 /DNA_ORIENTATION=+